MAAFMLNVRPSSPWMNAFTFEEWVAFGYVNDLEYYYCFGPGGPKQVAVGQVYANATLKLLQDGPEHGSMWWNFDMLTYYTFNAHDAGITPAVAALGLDSPSSLLPNDNIPFPSPYQAANIVPMGGHLTLERLTCSATAISKAGTFVRAVINEAIVPWSTCQSGPGYSCPLSEYAAMVDKVPNFRKECGVPAKYPQLQSYVLARSFFSFSSFFRKNR